MRTLVHCGCIVSCGSAERQKATVVIDDQVISGIEPGFIDAGSGDRVVSWEDAVVIPGLFDSHEHITLDSTGPVVPDADVETVLGIRAAKVCRDLLKQGVTTVRDAGAKRRINVSVKKAMKMGLFTGPDLLVAGHRIARTGFAKWTVCREADGADALRQVVRDEHKKGAEFIKLMVSGVVSGGGSPYDPQYSLSEIQAAVEEAHDLGLKVGVHAYGGLGTSRAIAAGVDVVEHGASLDDKDIEKMARNSTSLVVTYDAINHTAHSGEVAPHLRQKAADMIDSYSRCLPKVKEAGIKVAVGGDGHGFSPAAEMMALVRNGFTHSEAFAALTRNAAEVCGMLDKGAIARGFRADLVALRGNPIDDPHHLENVIGVVLSGSLLA